MSTAAPSASPSASRADVPAGSTRRSEPRDRFESVLARARRPAEARGEPPAAAPPTTQRPTVRAPSRAAPEERSRDAEPAPTTSSILQGPNLAALPGIGELQAAIRAAPPAIAAAIREAQPQLALHFGSALSIDLRAGAQGLELSLRPSPSLEHAARAELPRLVEALRAHGLRVARAEVRPGPGKQGPRERVDGLAGLRYKA